MSKILGIDTSNYTTSVAIFDTDTKIMHMSKKLLPVKLGELGIRQSDAVFHHTKQLPEVIGTLFSDYYDIDAVGVSYVPRLIDGSYMPCFLVGESLADNIGKIENVPVFKTSHQVGHILAGLYSSGRLGLLESDKPFIAFHVSGGTTDMLMCKPDDEKILSIVEIGKSLDLKAGQAVDRVGVMLGLKFPCGKGLEKLALKSDKVFKIKPIIKEENCCLSGIENQARRMFDKNEPPADIAKFCLMSIYAAIRGMTLSAFDKYGAMPLVYVGGVMSNSLIRDKISGEFNCNFALPEYSCDNAAGVAVFAAINGGFI